MGVRQDARPPGVRPLNDDHSAATTQRRPLRDDRPGGRRIVRRAAHALFAPLVTALPLAVAVIGVRLLPLGFEWCPNVSLWSLLHFIWIPLALPWACALAALLGTALLYPLTKLIEANIPNDV